MTVEMGKAGSVVKEIARIEGVKSVHAVAGPYDVIAFVEAPDMLALGETIISKVQGTPGVAETLTCVVAI